MADDRHDREARALVSDILAWSRVDDMRADVAELSALCEDMMPDERLLDDLSPDLRESRLQLLYMYLRERGKRRGLAQKLAGDLGLYEIKVLNL